MTLRRLALFVTALSLLFAAGACDSLFAPKPERRRINLKDHVSKKLYARDCKVLRTETDNRANPPTKYADAAKDVAYALRHNCQREDTKFTFVTWVYKNKKARDAALAGPFSLLAEDAKKGGFVYKVQAFDGPDLFMIGMVETANTSMVNEVVLLIRSMEGTFSEIAEDMEFK